MAAVAVMSHTKNTGDVKFLSKPISVKEIQLELKTYQ